VDEFFIPIRPIRVSLIIVATKISLTICIVGICRRVINDTLDGKTMTFHFRLFLSENIL